MGHASEFAMVRVHKIVVFAELEVVESDVLVVRIRVFFGVVDEFVFLVVEVVLPRRVGQAVLEDVSQLLRLAAEVKKFMSNPFRIAKKSLLFDLKLVSLVAGCTGRLRRKSSRRMESSGSRMKACLFLHF